MHVFFFEIRPTEELLHQKCSTLRGEFEHGDLSRAALSETKRTSRSEIGGVTSARWRQIGAIGTKAAFDSLQEDGVPEDRRTATDIDSLGADLSDGSNTGVRRIPGNQQSLLLQGP